MELTVAAQQFVLHWGEMGARWGINRTVAQTHALLFLSPQALNAEDIMNTLCVARSHVSTSLRELQAWGIVRVVHILGDRRDYFESVGDVWEMFGIILEERKRREIDPTVAMLQNCFEEARADGKTPAYTRQRIGEMLSFMETIDAWYSQVRRLPREAQVRLLKLGRKLPKILGAA